jgi:hypothetical protein
MARGPWYLTGWLCPRCNQVNSPAATSCQCGQRTPDASPWNPPEPSQPTILPVQSTRTTGKPWPNLPRVYCGDQDVERYSTRPPAA